MTAGCTVCGRDNDNGTHMALEQVGHLSHAYAPPDCTGEHLGLAQLEDLARARGYTLVARDVAPAEPFTATVFARINRNRVEAWHPGFPSDGWSGADWSNAMVGEAGETANVVKKLRRQDTDLRGAVDPQREVLLGKLADEIGDTYTYLDLLAQFYGLPDVLECAARKFDKISEREGLPQRMPPRGGQPC